MMLLVILVASCRGRLCQDAEEGGLGAKSPFYVVGWIRGGQAYSVGEHIKKLDDGPIRQTKSASKCEWLKSPRRRLLEATGTRQVCEFAMSRTDSCFACIRRRVLVFLNDRWKVACCGCRSKRVERKRRGIIKKKVDGWNVKV